MQEQHGTRWQPTSQRRRVRGRCGTHSEACWPGAAASVASSAAFFIHRSRIGPRMQFTASATHLEQPSHAAGPARRARCLHRDCDAAHSVEAFPSTELLGDVRSSDRAAWPAASSASKAARRRRLLSRRPPARDGWEMREHRPGWRSALAWSSYRVASQAGRRRPPVRRLSLALHAAHPSFCCRAAAQPVIPDHTRSQAAV